MTNQFEPKTVTSHPNIALIKYWGKSDIKDNLPTNESISLTLNNLITTTTIEESIEDLFILDNEIKEIPARMQNLINYFKEVSNYKGKLKIVSKNSFPHSCGLASSASGYSALVKALDSFFNLKLDSKTLSILARKGSGSASRSIFDGLVHLKKEGKEYFAEKLGEWKELRVILLVLNKESKKVPSTEGMLRTVNTSELFKKRLENINKKIKEMIYYIHTKNFKELAILTMKDSNEIHATCLDSFPPIFYLTDQSRSVIEDVFEINKNEVKVGYTFDAGANAFLITLDCYFEEIKSKFGKKYEIITAL